MSLFADLFNDQDVFDVSSIQQHEHSYENSTPQCERKYLDQFFEEGVLSSDNERQKNFSDTQDNFEKIEEEIQKQGSKIGLRLKSKFHNYQKHLIITLRKTVNIQKHPIHKCKQVIQELWKCFCLSRIYNKSLLRILFGEQMMEQQLNLSLFKKQGFKTIVDKYSPDEIIEAQHALRKIVLAHFEESSLDDLLGSRKLPEETKELFKKYIVEFIMELRQGNVMKRLPKSRKKQILKSA